MSKDRIWTLMSRKLSGEATEAELSELNELTKIHPDTGTSLQFIDQYWSVPAEKDEDFLEATFMLHSGRLNEKGFDLELNNNETGSFSLDFPSKQFNRKKRFYIAAAVCTVIIFFFVFINAVKNTSANNREKIAQSEVSTKNGSRTKIQLPDGSSVWLNSGSKLTYDNEHFGTGIREVSLTGEAYFDVVKNPAKPFIIHTAKMDVKVLGTAFNVKCYPGEKTTETSLIRGSVEVTLKGRQQKIIMKPNDKLIINDEDIKPFKINAALHPKKVPLIKDNPFIQLGHVTLYPADNSIVETGWVESRLIFSDETLEEIALKMERWYGVSIIIKNEKLKKELLTGSFENETIYQALDALQITTPFVYKINNNTITILK
jgi:transmembrane sensor